ncbi:MAG: metallophosphoesterase family protein, partial [Bdellovibrionota bacterium]
FVVIGDVHVTVHSQVSEHFKQVVSRIQELQPRAVVIDGDSTCGNEDDHYTEAQAAHWWSAFQDSLKPLQDSNIPILPLPGNHDYYRAPHRAAYLAAWSSWADQIPYELHGNFPVTYSLEIENTHLSLMPIVDQKIESDTADWLVDDLRSDEAQGAAFRFAFGHVPMVSVMGHSDLDFKRRMGTLLLDGGVDAYVAAHEHLVFDMPLQIGDRSIRQVTVGTASATYNFPLSQKTVNAFCNSDGLCKMPQSGLHFRINPDTRLERARVSFTRFDVYSDHYEATPIMIDDQGEAVTFH